MKPISYARLHYPPSIVQHVVWLYLRFNLSLRDVEDLLAERGLDVSYETVRRRVAGGSDEPTPVGSVRCGRGHLISRSTLRSLRGEAFVQWQAATEAAA